MPKSAETTQQAHKILIVDDHPENLLALETVLGDMDVETVRANSGEEALSLSLRHEFALVLMDVRMPGMDGIETACLLQARDKSLQTPVIFVTAHGLDEINKLEGHSLGIVDYILKPINTDILLNKVNMFLKLHEQSLQLSQQYEGLALMESDLRNKNIQLKKNNQDLVHINNLRERQHEQTRHLIELNGDAMLVLDDKNKIVFANSAALKLTKSDAKTLHGSLFGYTVTSGEVTEININDHDIELSKVPINWDGESLFLVTLHDISERKEIEKQLVQLAKYDHLTGLANREHCLDFLKKAIARAERRKGYLAILFVDLDKFKDINDSLGHDAGDVLLCSVAKVLSKCIREGDLAARFGGDEFAVILDEITTQEDAALVAKNIIESISVPHQLNGKSIIIRCSIGIATYPNCGLESETLFKAADLAMFHVKSEGRHDYRFFEDEMQKSLELRLKIENRIGYALEHNEFEVYYQPQYDISSRKIIAFEALLRWKHPEEGFIPPDRFIPVAERSGLIVDIGEYVLRTACLQGKLWQDAHADDDVKKNLTMAINVSIEQLKHGNFIDRLNSALHDTHFPASCLELELTESIMIDDPEFAIKELKAISEQSINVAMDDFGTGYSSLSYLRKFSLNTLKIDKSFVEAIGEDNHAEVIVRTIIAMAHSLGMDVVAEGVETIEQAAFLVKNKCNIMQGYYFSRPLPFNEAALLLEEDLTNLCDLDALNTLSPSYAGNSGQI